MVCLHGHSFDISRSGYINLLPAHFKRSKAPGDSKEMVLARRQFLDTDAYSPIANRINELALSHLKNSQDKTTYNYLDAGCGDGYYLQAWKLYASEKMSAAQHNCYGLDISKWAIEAAAKRYKGLTWLVASNKQPPIVEESLDLIFCTFGFPCYSAFFKALKPGGVLIICDAGHQHLIEARKILYPSLKPSKERDFSEAIKTGFIKAAQHTQEFQLHLKQKEDIHRLLAMTPHMYRSKQDRREILLDKTCLDLTVDICYSILSKP